MFIAIDNLLSIGKFKQHIDRRIETGSAFLEGIKKICNNRKIRLLGVIFPYFKPTTEYLQYETEEYAIMLMVLKKIGIEYIDLHNCFSSERRKTLRIAENDYILPSEEGLEIAAQAIYSILQDSIP